MNVLKNLKISCDHFPTCSGCVLNENVTDLALFKEVHAFFSKRGINTLTLTVDKVTQWRCRAKLAVRGSFSHPKIGLYKAGTHDVVDIPHCQVHHPSINKGVANVRNMIREAQIHPYDESTGSGELRYLQFVVERKTGKVQLALVFNADGMADPRVRKWLSAVHKLWNSSKLWHSIWLNFNLRRDNVIFNPQWHHLYGDALLWETIAGTEICFQPATFAQANLDLFEKMAMKIQEWVPTQASVTEFYAGVGVLGLTLVHQSRWVRCCELNPSARFCFEEAKDRLPEEMKAKISFYEGEAVKHQELMEDADVVLVDPPRKGLDLALLQALQATKAAKEIIYISCGWIAFQRDCDALLAAGWKIKAAKAYLFFPGSNQIELCAVFTKPSFS